MKVNSLLRTVLWIALALFLGAIVMGVLFPAGSNPLVARSKSLAARGRNLYRVYAQDELADNTWGGALSSCSNAAQFIERLLLVRNIKEWPADSVNKFENVWNIAVSVSNDCNDTFPVMISANFNPILLEGRIDDEKLLPIGLKSGASLSLLNDRAIALVRKDGSCEVINARHCTRKSILGTSCTSNSSAIYLTPEGKNFIRWNKAFHETSIGNSSCTQW